MTLLGVPMDDGLLFECPFQRGDRELRKWTRPPARQRQLRAIKVPWLRGSSPTAPTDVLIVSATHRRGRTKRTTRAPPQRRDEHSSEHLFAAFVAWRNLLVCRWTDGRGARGAGGQQTTVCAAVGGPSASVWSTWTATSSTTTRVSPWNINVSVGSGGRAARLATARRRAGSARRASPRRSRPPRTPA